MIESIISAKGNPKTGLIGTFFMKKTITGNLEEINEQLKKIREKHTYKITGEDSETKGEFVEYLMKEKSVIYVEILEILGFEEIALLLKKMGIKRIAPLYVKKDIYGILCLGEKIIRGMN